MCIRHGRRVRGHTLCWHSQTPAWLFGLKIFQPFYH
ncbi:endo-1,4-beta-xylanase [Foetidibacter luteolus]